MGDEINRRLSIVFFNTLEKCLTHAYKYSSDDVLGQVETYIVHLRIINKQLWYSNIYFVFILKRRTR
jgi:hypothetical protein